MFNLNFLYEHLTYIKYIYIICFVFWFYTIWGEKRFRNCCFCLNLVLWSYLIYVFVSFHFSLYNARICT